MTSTAAANGKFNHLPREVRGLAHSGPAPQDVEQMDIDIYNELLGELASKKDAVQIVSIIQKVSSREAFEAHSGGQPFDMWSFNQRLDVLELLNGGENRDWLVLVLDLLDAQAAYLFVEHEMKWSLTEGLILVLSENPTLASRIVTMLVRIPDSLRMRARLELHGANHWDYALVREGYQKERKTERVEEVLRRYEGR